MDEEKLIKAIFIVGSFLLFAVIQTLIWTQEDSSQRETGCYDRLYNKIKGQVCIEKTGASFEDKISESISASILFLILIFFTLSILKTID